MAVAHHLDLDMARLDDVFLDEDAVVAEGGARLVAGGAETLAHLGVALGEPHALAAAAGGRLDHDRIADALGDLDRRLRIGNDAQMAGHGRDAGRRGQLLRFDLVAHGGDGADIGADEGDAGGFERLGEGLALGEEAVAGMDRLRPGRFAGVDDAVDAKIAFGSGRAADRHRLVGLLDMEGAGIGLGIDRDRLDAHVLSGADDPAGDLASVGDQDLLEHGPLSLEATHLTPTLSPLKGGEGAT